MNSRLILNLSIFLLLVFVILVGVRPAFSSVSNLRNDLSLRKDETEKERQVLEKIKVDLDDGMRKNNIQIIVYRLEGGEPIIDFYIRKKGGGVETISVRYGEITEAYMRQLEEKIGKVYVFFKKERKVDFVGKATGHPPQ